MKVKSTLKTRILLILVCAICMMLGLATFFATSDRYAKAAAAEAEDAGSISIGDIQMRGIAGTNDWYCYLVLASDAYAGLDDKGESYGGEAWKNALSADKIKLYTSETDSGKTLQELGLSNATQNRWGVNGVFISFNGYNDGGYSGYEVYKVEISAGCKVPVYKDNAILSYTIDKDYTFVNLCYGDSSKKFGAMTPLADETTGKPEYICWLNAADADVTTVSGVEYHEDADGKYLLLKSSIHTTKIDGDINVSKYNTVAKVKIRMSKEDEDGVSIIGSMKYDDNGVRLYFDKNHADYSNINLATIYSVVIEGNCELPHGEKKCVTGGKILYGNADFGKDATATDGTNFAVITETIKTNVTGIQVRSTGGNDGYNFLVLQNSIYEAIPADTTIPNTSAYNTLDKITIYTSENDKTGVKASEICNAAWWTQNLWSSGGVMFEISDANYAAYNGSSIHRITIEKGCELPCGSGSYVIEKTYTWQNDGYGVADKKNGSFDWTRLKNREVADVEGVEVRIYRYLNNTYRFITLKNVDYSALTKDTAVDNAANYNALSKITIYTSPDDKTGVKASDICTGWWTQNLEGSGGISFQIKETIGDVDGFDLYNGKTIYAITIEEDCELPYGNDTIFVTSESVTYSNADYGRDVAKDYAYNWLDESIEIKDFGETEVTTLHNRAYQQDIGAARFLLFFLKQDYEMNKDSAFYMHKLNMLDKIKVYTSETDTEGILLRDIYRMSATMQGLGETKALCICLDPGEAADSTGDNPKYKYDGPHMYCVEIMEGCQFPFTLNGEYGYVTTTKTKKIYNKEYGKFGEILGQADYDGSKRTYEAWSIVWAQKVTVSFNVVGIDDLTIDSITTLGGSEINLADYEREGYTLVVTDSNGEEAYDVYTIPDSDVTLTLTYTAKRTNTDSSGSDSDKKSGCKSGCSGTIGAAGAGLLALVVLPAFGISFKRKKDD